MGKHSSIDTAPRVSLDLYAPRHGTVDELATAIFPVPKRGLHRKRRPKIVKILGMTLGVTLLVMFDLFVLALLLSF